MIHMSAASWGGICGKTPVMLYSNTPALPSGRIEPEVYVPPTSDYESRGGCFNTLRFVALAEILILSLTLTVMFFTEPWLSNEDIREGDFEPIAEQFFIENQPFVDAVSDEIGETQKPVEELKDSIRNVYFLYGSEYVDDIRISPFELWLGRNLNVPQEGRDETSLDGLKIIEGFETDTEVEAVECVRPQSTPPADDPDTTPSPTPPVAIGTNLCPPRQVLLVTGMAASALVNNPDKAGRIGDVRLIDRTLIVMPILSALLFIIAAIYGMGTKNKKRYAVYLFLLSGLLLGYIYVWEFISSAIFTEDTDTLGRQLYEGDIVGRISNDDSELIRVSSETSTTLLEFLYATDNFKIFAAIMSATAAIMVILNILDREPLLPSEEEEV